MSKNTHNQRVGSKVDRTDDRIKVTGEVFTPETLVDQMVSDIPPETLSDPSSRFLDNSAGSGNFLVGLLKVLEPIHGREHVIENMLYCVEKEADNHAEICERLGVSTTHPHYVCADALEYDYSFGEPVGLESFM